MGEVSERYRRVAGSFTAVAAAVPEDGWDQPSPCEGWAARDIVGHLTSWVPAFLADGAGVDAPALPPVADDPVAAWRALDGWLQGLVDDPSTASAPFSHPQAGEHRLDDAIARFVLGDVLIHTWDVARSVGRDVALDPDEVAQMRAGLAAMGDALAGSGHYRPAVPMPADADDQAHVLALTGRNPGR